LEPGATGATTTATAVPRTVAATPGSTTPPAPPPTVAEPVTLDDPALAYAGKLDGPRVLVVGDSITDRSAPLITPLLDRDVAHRVFGLSGYKLAEAEPFLTPYPPTLPAVVIIELGTNDGNDILADRSGATRAAWKERLVGYHDLFPGTCFVPITMPARRGDPAWDASQQELNDWLLATFPRTIDWNGYELGQRAVGRTLLEPDGIHPDAAGAAAIAVLYRFGVDRCLAERGSAAGGSTAVP
jgi:hypothetical protein